jgi:hypothetical protein
LEPPLGDQKNKKNKSKKRRGKAIAELHGEEEMKEDGVQFRYLDFYYQE